MHIIIEACIDIAQHIISDEGFREPSSYRDTFAVLAEHGVLRKEDLERFENIASFRNLIVHYYERVDDVVLCCKNSRMNYFHLWDLLVPNLVVVRGPGR